ncbi:hypothetical protein PCASD_23704 [Puccinia coronata f. sp. avenae]|uniref:Fatty acid synthase subunit alpha acyl carrier domain-containing protein n=1 Tax=Puccinia coronata f. sp. avenae TaxID=200324 RepID=A0A2N5U788_9BASI|nr:hypothetical protein PCASD_23704 [Puccinia coronata f. sp. avenae]
MAEISTIATEILDTPADVLAAKWHACVVFIHRIQQIKKIWDKHDDEPYRGWYAVAGLSRVLGWLDVEKCFWRFKPPVAFHLPLVQEREELSPASDVEPDPVSKESYVSNPKEEPKAEFGSAPDKLEEMLLGKLGAALQSSYSGTIGKHMSALITRLMPGGSEAEDKSYLDSVMQVHGKHSGITLSQGGATGAVGGSAGGAMINLEGLEKFQQSQDAFESQQLEVQSFKRDSRNGYRLHDLKHAD